MRRVALLLGSAAVGAVTLGIVQYVLNYRWTGGPFGGLRDVQDRELGAGENLLRVAWSFVESPGLPLPWADRIIRAAVDPIAPPPQVPFTWTLETLTLEDTVSAGLIGLCILIPLVLVVAVHPRSALLRRALALAGICFVVLFGLVHLGTPYNGRILMPAYSLAAPLLAFVAVRAWSRTVAATLAVLTLAPVVLVNQTKPVLGDPEQPSIWTLSAAQQQSVSRPEQAAVIELLDREFPAGSTLAFSGGEDSWDYPLFGRSLERTVIRIRPETGLSDRTVFCRVATRLVDDEDIDGLVLADLAPPPGIRPTTIQDVVHVYSRSRLERCRR